MLLVVSCVIKNVNTAHERYLSHLMWRWGRGERLMMDRFALGEGRSVVGYGNGVLVQAER